MIRLGPRAIQLKTTIIGTRSSHTEPNKKIKKLLLNNKRVLDIGCGNGRHFIFPLTVGIDADITALRSAKERGICLCGDGQNLPFRQEIFDLSLFSYSIEYMKDPEQARDESRRVSKAIHELIYPGYYSWENVNKRRGESL